MAILGHMSPVLGPTLSVSAAKRPKKEVAAAEAEVRRAAAAPPAPSEPHPLRSDQKKSVDGLGWLIPPCRILPIIFLRDDGGGGGVLSI
eukprot:s1998_g4.t1